MLPCTWNRQNISASQVDVPLIRAAQPSYSTARHSPASQGKINAISLVRPRAMYITRNEAPPTSSSSSSAAVAGARKGSKQRKLWPSRSRGSIRSCGISVRMA
ncbi:Os07g0554850 [Oryza sativa Japonica Group]|uniref:Os07g0554850 protein n=1 Tax=Oryza sativa subsp. japonica TaxID=39947 RepID=A0A0P0X7U6_ORYSJ|nr:hypothetical protein EE612_039957 [Oryza sativa]BAT02088.1 Os07g0554850 [Oryza sativa Japonica Group]